MNKGKMQYIKAALLALLVVSCSDSDQAGPPASALLDSALTFLRFNDDAYQAAQKSGGFWAVPGQSRSVELRYSDSNQAFLRFEVGPNSLVTQDSVFISVDVDATGRLAFDFQPAGLQFNSSAPAILRIDRARSNPDIDGDGSTDLTDILLSLQVGIWKRELPMLPWVRLPTLNLLGTVMVVEVDDFTNFGMAVD
jgi:hypothetical protein